VFAARGARVSVSEPRLFHVEQQRAIPWPFQTILRVVAVFDFLELRPLLSAS